MKKSILLLCMAHVYVWWRDFFSFCQNVKACPSHVGWNAAMGRRVWHAGKLDVLAWGAFTYGADVQYVHISIWYYRKLWQPIRQLTWCKNFKSVRLISHPNVFCFSFRCVWWLSPPSVPCRVGCETAASGPALPKKARETERKLPFLIFFPAAPNKIQMLCVRVIPPFQLHYPASVRLSRS